MCGGNTKDTILESFLTRAPWMTLLVFRMLSSALYQLLPSAYCLNVYSLYSQDWSGFPSFPALVTSRRFCKGSTGWPFLVGKGWDGSFINLKYQLKSLVTTLSFQSLEAASSLWEMNSWTVALMNPTFHTSGAPDNFLYSIILSGSGYGLWILYLICWLLCCVPFLPSSHFSKVSKSLVPS